MTLQLGPGRLYVQQGEGDWVAIGTVEATELQVMDPPRAGLVVGPRLRKGYSWTRTLSRSQTRALADAFVPDWRWAHWDGPRARAEYDRRRRARHRRGRR